MTKKPNILISVEQRHADNMLSGAKTVELRRRAVRVPSGARVWVYSKLPRGQVDLLAIVDEVHEGSPNKIWNKLGDKCALDKAEFDSYFKDIETAYAIEFREIRKLKTSVALSELRARLSYFNPPQFFKFLHPNSPELTLLEASSI